MKNIIVITNIAPFYRSLLWESLLKHKEYNFDFYFGDDIHSGIKEINFNEEKFTFVQSQIYKLKNVYFKKKVLIWQNGLITRSLFLKVDAAIILGDSWIISNWIVALILRLKGVKVVFWSHGIYGNEPKLKKWFRTLFYKLANEHLLYERRGKRLMIEAGFNANKLHIIFNSLDYKANLVYRSAAENFTKNQMYTFFENPELPAIIFIGRLTEVKKLNYLIDSIQLLKKQNHLVNLLLIGEGDQKKNLHQQVKENNIENQCHFYGACYSEEVLAKLISTADLCVSPGNVGLTAIHSMSYGTPVMTHNNFSQQMPEVGAIIEGNNGCYFKENDVDSMVHEIKDWLFNNSLSRKEIRDNCYEIVDTFYNPNYQVKIIENLLENKPPLI